MKVATFLMVCILYVVSSSVLKGDESDVTNELRLKILKALQRTNSLVLANLRSDVEEKIIADSLTRDCTLFSRNLTPVMVYVVLEKDNLDSAQFLCEGTVFKIDKTELLVTSRSMVRAVSGVCALAVMSPDTDLEGVRYVYKSNVQFHAADCGMYILSKVPIALPFPTEEPDLNQKAYLFKSLDVIIEVTRGTTKKLTTVTSVLSTKKHNLVATLYRTDENLNRLDVRYVLDKYSFTGEIGSVYVDDYGNFYLVTDIVKWDEEEKISKISNGQLIIRDNNDKSDGPYCLLSGPMTLRAQNSKDAAVYKDR